MALLSGDPADVGVLGAKLGASVGGVPLELVAELSVVGDDVELADEGCKEVRGIVDEVVTGEALDESVEEISVDWLFMFMLVVSKENEGSKVLELSKLGVMTVVGCKQSEVVELEPAGTVPIVSDIVTMLFWSSSQFLIDLLLIKLIWLLYQRHILTFYLPFSA